MTTTPESSSFDTQSGRTSDLEVGLTAFKEAEYATAIILLEPALTESPDQPLIARAQMALAIAYEKMAETERAAQLCQSLQASRNPQVQDWATRTLASLVKRHPELTRFQGSVLPVEAASPDVDVASAVNPEATGFMPLDAASLPPVGEQPWADAPSPAIAPLPDPSPTGLTSSPPGRATRPAKPRMAQTAQPPQPDLTPPSLYQPQWRQAGRAQSWKPLGTVKWRQLALTQIGTAIALYFAVQQILFWIAASYGNAIIKTLPRLGFRIVQPGNPTWTEAITLIILLIVLIGSRWILDGLFAIFHGLKPLSLQELSVYSPEAAASLSRFCQKAKVPMPALGILPTKSPLILTYGILPKVSRTVISQGVLDQLADDEIAALYANEIGHLRHWTVPLMSGIAVLLQLPYTLYWQTAEWGNRKDSPITKASTTFIAGICYGFFWLWRWVPLWLSRKRTHYSDRVATDLTGNPNGYTRALLKLAIATAQDLQQQKQTSYLLEGFEILSPLGYRIAAPLGSLYPHAPLEPILAWERTNPLRHWLALNNTHPPTGARLELLARYAQHWRLDTELNWPATLARRSKSEALSGSQWRSLLLQGAPYFGCAFGVVIALMLKVIGILGVRMRWEIVSWMASDQTILIGLPLVSVCVGILIRLNPFFPDLQVQGRKTGHQETLPPLLANATLIPLNSQTVRLEGTVIGRQGIGNMFHQDLWLNTAKGLIQLHYTDRLGVLQGLFPTAQSPSTRSQTPLTTTGWFRRGATPWIDVDTLQTRNGRVDRSAHPTWSLVIAVIAASWGILTLFNFRF